MTTWDTARRRPSAGRGERPQGEPAVPRVDLTSSLQTCERINVGVSAPSLRCLAAQPCGRRGRSLRPVDGSYGCSDHDSSRAGPACAGLVTRAGVSCGTPFSRSRAARDGVRDSSSSFGVVFSRSTPSFHIYDPLFCICHQMTFKRKSVYTISEE